MDVNRALALSRAVSLVAASVQNAIEMYKEDVEMAEAVRRHPAGKAPRLRPLREDEEDQR